MEEDPKMGPCCICSVENPSVRNIVMLPYLCPIPGRGWGCVVCGLPNNGAVAILCDECMEGYQNDRVAIQFICNGYPGKDGRTPFKGYDSEVFEHNVEDHPEFKLFDKNGNPKEDP